MTQPLEWARLSRDTLTDLLPDALVVLPLGATEQHGPHLATGTDTLAVEAVARRAAALAAPRAGRPLVLAPPLAYGASDHHLALGATLSLAQRTLVAVLADLLRSMHTAGARRVLLLNGHGGNRHAAALAAADAAREHGFTVIAASYWELAEARGARLDVPAGALVPGHAGWLETSLMLALDPALSGAPPSRPGEQPPIRAIAGGQVEDHTLWARIDGFTDDPSQAGAAAGEQLLEAVSGAVAGAIIEAAEPA